MEEPPSTPGVKPLTLNLAIGPSCFVQCRGCYNNFGKTARRGGLVTRAEVSHLVDMAVSLDYTQATVSGGDPLTHPDIVDILADLRAAGMFVKLDTVGSAMLRPSREAFFGDASVEHWIEPERVLELVDVIGLPLDGSTEAIQRRFRLAPKASVDSGEQLALFGESSRVLAETQFEVASDTLQLVNLASHHEVDVCINTVVHAGNIHDVSAMARVLLGVPPTEWQLFQFQSTGLLASKNRRMFALDTRTQTIDLASRLPRDELFIVKNRTFDEAVVTAVRLVDGKFRVAGKSAAHRIGAYLLVNDAGDLWLSGTEARPAPRRLASIRGDRAEVRTALERFSAAQLAAG